MVIVGMLFRKSSAGFIQTKLLCWSKVGKFGAERRNRPAPVSALWEMCHGPNADTSDSPSVPKHPQTRYRLRGVPAESF